MAARSKDPRDDLVAWWVNEEGDMPMLVEPPGDCVLAAVRYNAKSMPHPWEARLCDGTLACFATKGDAVYWAGEKGVAFASAPFKGVAGGPDFSRH